MKKSKERDVVEGGGNGGIGGGVQWRPSEGVTFEQKRGEATSNMGIQRVSLPWLGTNQWKGLGFFRKWKNYCSIAKFFNLSMIDISGRIMNPLECVWWGGTVLCTLGLPASSLASVQPLPVAQPPPIKLGQQKSVSTHWQVSSWRAKPSFSLPCWDPLG